MQHPLQKFRFCPQCGCEHFEVNDFKSKRCTSCGFTFYHNVAAATVAVIVNDQGELLTVRRALEPARGTLDLPGGFVDASESVEQGCVREVREELGVEASVVRYLFSLPNVYRYSEFDVHTVDSFFLCSLSNDAMLKADDDVSDYQFIAINKLVLPDFGLNSVRMGVERLMKCPQLLKL